jgi:hypothetical protein
MSSRCNKKHNGRYPAVKRETFQVGHVTFEVNQNEDDGATFALIAGEAATAKDRRPLFSGHISVGMSNELRKLAFRIQQLEPKKSF